ncbi:MAG: hypothetical protein IT515_18430 [Burkholderiales bacterium]|nr:hypothetical protein [Burkholderiales bacterium]
MSDAPNLTYAETLQYLRVGRRAFDMHLRPLLPKPVKVGTRIVWKRIDVERAWEEYAFQRNGRPEESRSRNDHY